MRRPRLAEHFEDLDKQEHASRFAMWAFLGSEVLLFGALLALYVGYRALYPVDFAAAVGHNNAAIGTTNTVVLITSSFTVAMALHAVREGHLRRAAGLLAFSVGSGLLFLALKALEYTQHFREGIFPGIAYHYAGLPTFGAKMFFTLYYFLTGLHAIHVTIGLGLLTGAAVGCLRGRYSPAYYMPVELFALYWHLVDVIWIFLWPLLYLLHR